MLYLMEFDLKREMVYQLSKYIKYDAILSRNGYFGLIWKRSQTQNYSFLYFIGELLLILRCLISHNRSSLKRFTLSREWKEVFLLFLLTLILFRWQRPDPEMWHITLEEISSVQSLAEDKLLTTSLTLNIMPWKAIIASSYWENRSGFHSIKRSQVNY